jgi:hypothetical protein
MWRDRVLSKATKRIRVENVATRESPARHVFVNRVLGDFESSRNGVEACGFPSLCTQRESGI